MSETTTVPEFDIATVLARLERWESMVRAATPGPWNWRGNTSTHFVWLGAMNHTIMTFRRWGMQGALPAFNVDHRMTPATEMFERPEPQNPWKVTGINHPDADLIAEAPLAMAQMTESLRAALNQLQDQLEFVNSDGVDEYHLEGDYQADARYTYPARERWIRANTEAALAAITAILEGGASGE